MAEVRWIKKTLFVLLLLQFTAVTGQTLLSLTTRVGDEVTLPCDNVIKNQDKCDGTHWLHSSSGASVELVNLGRIRDKSNRLGLTADCSLVIRNVTTEDVGHYTCRQFNKAGGPQQGQDASVRLFVIDMEEHNSSDTVYLYCVVLRDGVCEHTVEWLYEGKKNDVETSQNVCTARVTFKTRHLNQKSKYYELLKCNVTDKRGNTLLYEVCNKFSCEKTVRRNNPPPANNDTPTQPALPGWWRFIILGLATLVLIVVAVYMWKRTRGSRTQMDVNAVHHEDEDEDEGTVTYENVGEPSASVRLH